nr:glutamate racemase [Photobacterium aquae]
MKRVVIFDSGVGGLSVYQEIRAQMPGLQYIYTFDNAAFPYGELPESELIERTLHIVSELVAGYQADLVVVACNTASTVVLPALRSVLAIPVVGVVPAIKPAAQLSQQKVLGLLATPATVRRQYTDTLIADFASDCEVLRLGSTRLVEMAEQKLRREPIDMDELRRILQPWQGRVDTIILGCTHFPLIKTEITQAFEQSVQIVDSGKAIANRVRTLLGASENVGSGNNHAYFSAADIPATLKQSLRTLGFTQSRSLNFPRRRS